MAVAPVQTILNVLVVDSLLVKGKQGGQIAEGELSGEPDRTLVDLLVVIEQRMERPRGLELAGQLELGDRTEEAVTPFTDTITEEKSFAVTAAPHRDVVTARIALAETFIGELFEESGQNLAQAFGRTVLNGGLQPFLEGRPGRVIELGVGAQHLGTELFRRRLHLLGLEDRAAPGPDGTGMPPRPILGCFDELFLQGCGSPRNGFEGRLFGAMPTLLAQRLDEFIQAFFFRGLSKEPFQRASVVFLLVGFVEKFHFL